MKPRRFLMMMGIALFFLIHAPSGKGADFPNKPIRILVGWTAGSGTDTMLRALAPKVEKILGQSLLIENKPGGTGVLALELLKLAKPDGYTLAGTGDNPITAMPHITKVSYDPMKDFASIVMIYRQALAVLVKSDSPFKTFRDLIDYARKNPGKLTVGIPGRGTSIHLGFMKIANQEKVEFEFVAFQGSAPTTTAILGGHVMSAGFATSACLPHVKAGSLRALVVFNEKRLEDLPDVPISDELGYGADISSVVPYTGAVLAPRMAPKAVRDRLTSAFSEGIQSPEYRRLISTNGMTLPDSPLVGETLDKHYAYVNKIYGDYIEPLGLKKK